MIRLLLLAIVVAALVTASVVLVTGGRPRTRRLSTAATRSLAGLGIIALVTAVGLGFTAGDLWPLTPLVAWVGAVLVVRDRETRRRRRTVEQRRRRLDDFGADGVALMDRADAAVGRVMSSEAVTDGWLGDLDFTADLTMVADTLRRLTALRATAAELAALPTPGADDRRILREARTTAATLERAVTARVEALEDCARQSKQIDQTLQRQRDQARIAAQRDAARGRLDTLLHGTDAPAGSSDATDAVTARVDAFHELRAIIDAQRRDEP